MPNPAKKGIQKGKAEVEEIYSDHVILRGKSDNLKSENSNSNQADSDEAPHTEIILTGIPLHRSGKLHCFISTF